MEATTDLDSHKKAGICQMKKCQEKSWITSLLASNDANIEFFYMTCFDLGY